MSAVGTVLGIIGVAEGGLGIAEGPQSARPKNQAWHDLVLTEPSRQRHSDGGVGIGARFL
jgi:hypothetical protein